MKIEDFHNQRLALWPALRFCPEDERDAMWVSALVRKHMVVQHATTKELYYVVRQTAWYVSLLPCALPQSPDTGRGVGKSMMRPCKQ